MVHSAFDIDSPAKKRMDVHRWTIIIVIASIIVIDGRYHIHTFKQNIIVPHSAWCMPLYRCTDKFAVVKLMGYKICLRYGSTCCCICCKLSKKSIEIILKNNHEAGFAFILIFWLKRYI